FFFQAEDGIRDFHVTGVQTCALPIFDPQRAYQSAPFDRLGVTPIGENRYEAIIVGQMFAFIPPEIRVPVGARVDFIATSADVIRSEERRVGKDGRSRWSRDH